MVYTSFTDWERRPNAPLYYMDQTTGFNTYVAAPELFYFRPQQKWYLVFQSGPPMYSSSGRSRRTPRPGRRRSRSSPRRRRRSRRYGGDWLDFWVICDDASCHLFFSDNHGRWFHSKTSIDQFPNGFGDPVVVLQDSNTGRVFEASQRLQGERDEPVPRDHRGVRPDLRQPPLLPLLDRGQPRRTVAALAGQRLVPVRRRAERLVRRAAPGRTTSATARRSAPATTRRSHSIPATFATSFRAPIRTRIPAATTTRFPGSSAS